MEPLPPSARTSPSLPWPNALRDLERGQSGNVVTGDDDDELCPITLERIDALPAEAIYTAPDGRRYNRSALARWFRRSNIMPHTNEPAPAARREVLAHRGRQALVQFIEAPPQQLGPPRPLRPVQADEAHMIRNAYAGICVAWPIMCVAGVHWGRERDSEAARIMFITMGVGVGLCAAAALGRAARQAAVPKLAVQQAAVDMAAMAASVHIRYIAAMLVPVAVSYGLHNTSVAISCAAGGAVILGAALLCHVLIDRAQALGMPGAQGPAHTLGGYAPRVAFR